ncbi:deoxyribose-phosphate aldolase [Lactonifactor longoviformis]|uniref:Deoxyribose-phosphate aldolase n=1 Tax=Lactonifactor longoviformis DSM 17459 TaxID=1122155 RepID=A0A1M4UR97_9CLOT|nr:deoxyribose-phosphate aldolase [Lactonifactor longoviformis]POP31002.1 deoxyribose-phosphate aldolase [Lactonifactor longoviformis]SHE59133.1 deoxyribose-phosphate aldolase [Lactonifactor longoviformis DSM 17459]
MELLSVKELAKYLDHVIEIDHDFEEQTAFARNYGVACCAVAENNVADIKALLKNSGVMVSGAVAFPGGDSMPDAKIIDVQRCIDLGADEVDYVINLTELKQHRWCMVEEEMGRIAELCRKNGVADKAIIETCLLTREEKIRVCEIAKEVRPAFIKTSTGMRSAGASVEDVRLLRSIVGDSCKIKAAGGIRTYYIALAMIEAGADRMGTSSAKKLLDGYAAYLESLK